MLALISPAKKLNFDRENSPEKFTDLRFQKETNELLKTTSKLKAIDLKSLMKLSDDLSELNYQRFQSLKFPFTPDNAKQAAFAFNGDTYAGFDAPTLSSEELDYAQDHVRILSGLYGLVRPLDLIQPYRLEMGIKLANKRGANLYEFWDNRIAEALNEELKAHKNPTIINVASNEYFKAVKRKALKFPVITPVFKEVKGDVAKVIGFSAKRARGMMARFISQNKIETTDGIKDFNLADYSYQPNMSSDSEYHFYRTIS
ncbi:MAG: peroxide stress protein YaaA [Sneathiella sp.]